MSRGNARLEYGIWRTVHGVLPADELIRAALVFGVRLNRARLT